MKAHTVNFINAIVLIVMPFGGYFLKDSPSVTSLIPAAFGVLLLFCQKGIKRQNKLSVNVAVVLTVLVFLLLIMPFRFVIRKEDTIGIIQISAMLLTSFLALISFVYSYVKARKP